MALSDRLQVRVRFRDVAGSRPMPDTDVHSVTFPPLATPQGAVTLVTGRAPALTATELDDLAQVALTDVDLDEADARDWPGAATGAVPTRKRLTAIVPPLGEPSTSGRSPLRQLRPTAAVWRPSTAPMTAGWPRHPTAVIPPLSGESRPAPRRRLAHGTAPIEGDRAPTPTSGWPAPGRALAPEATELELVDTDQVRFDDLD